MESVSALPAFASNCSALRDGERLGALSSPSLALTPAVTGVTECQVSILRSKCFSKQAICARILQEPHSEMNLHCGYSFMCNPSQSTAWCALCTIKCVTEGGGTQNQYCSHTLPTAGAVKVISSHFENKPSKRYMHTHIHAGTKTHMHM